MRGWRCGGGVHEEEKGYIDMINKGKAVGDNKMSNTWKRM